MPSKSTIKLTKSPTTSTPTTSTPTTSTPTTSTPTTSTPTTSTPTTSTPTLYSRYSQLVRDIAKKKELSTLPTHSIEQTLQSVLKSNPKLELQKNITSLNSKSKEYKQLLKLTREKLRRNYGLFRKNQTTSSTIHQTLHTFFIKPSPKLLQELLSIHESTKERLTIYPKLYQQIFKITGKPQSILDLACGLNPLSLPYSKLDLNILTYHACDISTAEIDIIQDYFNHLKTNYPSFQGIAEVQDLKNNHHKILPYPKTDITFCLKILDLLDQNRGHKPSEHLLEQIPSKFIVTSFATKTMSGKPMTAPKRRWMEWLCKRKGWKYHLLEFENELLYIIQK